MRRLSSAPPRRKATAIVTLDAMVTAFLDHHRDVGHSPSSIRHYQQSLEHFQRFRNECGHPNDARALTPPIMSAFAGWLRTTPVRPWRGNTERSVYGTHGVLKDVKVWVRWLAETEYIPEAPKVPIPKLPTKLFPVLTDDDLDRVFACKQLAGNTEIAIRNRALVAFMLDTGVRLAEVAGLALADIDLKDGSARIRGKGSKERMVYFSEGVTEAIRRWLIVRGNEEGTLFWLESAGVTMLLKRIKAETGLPMLTPHQLRHTAFTAMVRHGVDLHTVKRLAGHASVTTTEAYLALAGDDLKDKQNAASPFDQVAARIAPQAGKRRLKVS